MTPESRALVSVFFGMQSSKKSPFGAPAKPAANVAVVGAGLMGAGIGQVTVDKGLGLTIKDASRAGLARGLEQIYANLNTQTKKRKITSCVPHADGLAGWLACLLGGWLAGLVAWWLADLLTGLLPCWFVFLP